MGSRWDDQGHPHPDALRWTELDLIARAAAVIDPTLRHPGPVLALASRFVVLGPDDDLDAITPMMDAAYGQPPPGATWWPRTREWLHRVDGRYNGIAWQRDDAGDWTVDQREADEVDRGLSSLRCPDGEFPFVDWRKLVAAAEATLVSAALPTPQNPAEACWIEEVRTGAPRGSLIAARFGPSPLRNSRRYLTTLSLSLDGRPDGYRAEVCADLGRTLRGADRGRARFIGGSSTIALVSVVIIDDLGAGVETVREVLRRHAADADARLTHGRRALPLS